MKHFGDITKLSGYELPVVDVITGGSPCQDLSVAGKRAGLLGERSGLFMEQIRIVKEMRDRDRATGRTGRFVRPRYMVWENVPGAFSSNGGKDFQAVLEEIVKIVEEEVPDLSDAVQGGWTKSGCLYSDVGHWSVAWRVHDAQLWGVPQRRKRIALVADFGGLSAPEILFERKGLSGNFEPGGTEREGTAHGIESGADSTGEPVRDGWVESEGTYYDPGYREPDTISFQERASKPGGARESLSSMNTQEPCQRSTTKASAFKAGNGAKAGSIGYENELAPTLSAAESGTNQVPTLVCGNPWDSQSERVYDGDGPWHSVNSNSGGDRAETRSSYAVDCRNGTENECVNGTLQAKEQGFNLNSNNVVRTVTHGR